ncbi:hypothetical protein ABR855_13030 [Aeromonas hydrophila]|uniref:hypothetical protein n=1 Tax=Aeromonas hydrophila TaxID=644 RepID=UPI0033061AD4
MDIHDNDTSAEKSFIKQTGEDFFAIINDPGFKKTISRTTWAIIKKFPIAGDLLEVLSETVAGLADQERVFRQQRLVDYIRGVAQIRRDHLDIQDEDLLIAIRRVIDDDEAGKAEYYARLTVNMVENNVKQAEKLHFLTMLSELTCSQINYALEFYIRDTIPLCGYSDIDSAVGELVNKNDGRSLRARSILVSWGILHEVQDGASGVIYKRTEDLNKLVGFLFHEMDRQPNAIGKDQKLAFDVIIVDCMKSTENLYCTYLHKRLEEAGLRVDIVERVSDHQLQKIAKRYVWNNKLVEMSGGHKEYIQIVTLDTPPSVGSPQSESLRQFKLEIDKFNSNFSRGSNMSKSKAELMKILDKVAVSLMESLKNN